ncbi:Imm1 family immunity protein [Saccharopolyspora spinosa]|uniref:Imm1 family immunity protein n=1 Tax=Saccharopolyspora spinosa TaxID=60894 RepID=UPI00117B2DA0|nr:Imm1 family immunity protein [Saccharopolyspora spinosa]
MLNFPSREFTRHCASSPAPSNARPASTGRQNLSRAEPDDVRNACVPPSTVEEALAESLQTAQRPRALQWQAAPDPDPDR